MALPDPVTREEMYLSKAATGAGELPTPVTRKEMFLNGLATGTKSGLTPITREEMFLDAIEPGGGGDITLETLNVSENGTKNAPAGTAYNKVNVSVPVPTLDTLTATDNGTFTPQSGHAYDEVVVNVPKGITPSGTLPITENGTYDVTQYASAEVNVQSGGEIEDSDFLRVHSETLTIGANTITNTAQYAQYLTSAKSIPGVVFAMSIRKKPSYVYNEIGCASNVHVDNFRKAYRYRSGNWGTATWNDTSYDAKAVEGTIVDIYTYEQINPADTN